MWRLSSGALQRLARRGRGGERGAERVEARRQGGEECARQADFWLVTGELQGERLPLGDCPGDESDGRLAAERSEPRRRGRRQLGAGEAEKEHEIAAAQLQVRQESATGDANQ